MRLAEVTKDVSEQLAEVAERYQVPERLRVASDVARRGAQTAYDNAYRGAQRAYQLARDNPRASVAAAGVIVAAAIVGGVLWYIFGRETEQEQQRTTRRVRAGTGRKRANTTRSARATA